MTVNPERGEVAITVDGRERVLRPTTDAIVKWETATGLPTYKLAEKLSKDAEQRSVLMKDLLAVILPASEDGLTKDDLSEEIGRRGFLWMTNPAFFLLLNALNGGSSSSEAAPAGGGGQGEAVAADQTPSP